MNSHTFSNDRFFVLLLSCFVLFLIPSLQAQDDDYTTPTVMPIKVINGIYVERSVALELFGEKSNTIHDLIRDIEKAKTDDEVGALGLQVMRPAMGLAQATELRSKILDFKTSGKPVIAVTDMIDTRGYYIASAADHVVMSPVGSIISPGLSLDLYFFKDMLAKLGISVQAVNTGKYKNALEPLTHHEMTEGTREQYGRLLELISGEMIQAVAQARSMTADEVESKLFTGPHLSDQAMELGLITEIGYPFETLKKYASEMNLEEDWEYSGEDKKRNQPPSLFSLFSGSGSFRKKVDRDEKVALIYALGNIIDGYSEDDPFSTTQMIASDSFIELLDEAVEENAKAIVIRVNSGGGSAVASDRIWNKINEIKGMDIPVVVSMGNVAASGGYYISMNADRIFAQPTTVTGSIGVISGKINLSGTYEKIGVNKDSLYFGENVWLFDETKDLTSEQMEFASALLEEIYDDFTAKAGEGRGMSQEAVKNIGGGRVWLGKDALENGLIDELGGMESAIYHAKILAGDEDLPVVTYPKEKTLSELLDDIMMGNIQIFDPKIEALLQENWQSEEHMMRILQVINITNQLLQNKLQVMMINTNLLSFE